MRKSFTGRDLGHFWAKKRPFIYRGKIKMPDPKKVRLQNYNPQKT
jgi:hypothetical protein